MMPRSKLDVLCTMQWFMTAGAMLLVSFGVGCAHPQPQSSNEGKNLYPVRVEVRELRNRIVEGTVRQHRLYVDQPKAFGADDTAPTPPETLAFAIGGCVVSTGRLIAMQQNLPVKAISAVVEGQLDFSRALGLSTTKRAGYESLRVTVSIDTSLSAEGRAKLLSEISARCPMCDNLSGATPVTIE